MLSNTPSTNKLSLFPGRALHDLLSLGESFGMDKYFDRRVDTILLSVDSTITLFQTPYELCQASMAWHARSRELGELKAKAEIRSLRTS